MPMRLSPVLVGAALLLTACGGSSATTSTDGSPDSNPADDAVPADAAPADPAIEEGDPAGPVGDAPAAEVTPEVTPEVAAEMAATNLADLVVADDPTATEVLVVSDGSVTTISEAATGDRPLLLWFWAPH